MFLGFVSSSPLFLLEHSSSLFHFQVFWWARQVSSLYHDKLAALDGESDNDALTWGACPWEILVRDCPWGLENAAWDSALSVVGTAFVAWISLRRAESLHGVARPLTGMFLTVGRPYPDATGEFVDGVPVASADAASTHNEHVDGGRCWWDSRLWVYRNL